ncbi:MAG: cytochrome b/b6 domain-containing protein [Immundisolibacter sp.]
MTPSCESTAASAGRRVRVWDGPVRLFHWLLVVFLAGGWISVEAGIEYMQWHMRCGYAVLVLLVFRLLWGVWGSDSARFRGFLRGPRAVIGYAWAWLSRRPQHFLGHNPLGGWMVVLLLVLVAVQAITGLFANDDIFNEGPLAAWVGKETSDWLTFIHKRNFNLLLAAVGLHVTAVMLYLVRGENLVKAMFTGSKPAAEYVDRPPVLAPWWRAVVLLALSAGAVWLLVDVLP